MEKKKKKKWKTDMLRSLGKQSGKSMESVRKKKKWEGFAEKESFKSGVEEWRDNGELMELMEEVPLKELGDAKLERLVRGWRREAGSNNNNTK